MKMDPEQSPSNEGLSLTIEKTEEIVARIEQAEARTELAELRTERAETRSEQAEIRTAEAEARAGKAEVRSEQAEIRTGDAELRTGEAEMRTGEAEKRTEKAEMRSERAGARSDEAILASELSYRRLFEAAKDGILILDAKTGRISDANPFLISLLGFSLDEMIGRTVGELSPFKDIEANQVMLDRLQKGGYVRYEELPLEARDGNKIAVEFISNVYEAGDHTVIQCNIRDITAQKAAQEEIRLLNSELEQRVKERTADLEKANDDLDAFTYSVSHDLRAPLRHVLGFVELLEEEGGKLLTEKGRHFLTTISDSAQRMGEMIDDLLSFSRDSRAEMKLTPVSLGTLVKESIDDLQPDIQGRGIAWRIGTLPDVMADRSLMRNVMDNLLGNAVKFTRQRDQAEIEVGSMPGPEGEAVIFVRDNGAGFDAKYADKLFGVFQRLHSQTDFEGTGVGLATVQRIIQRHHGKVWATGTVGEGATFLFSLPGKVQPK